MIRTILVIVILAFVGLIAFTTISNDASTNDNGGQQDVVSRGVLAADVSAYDFGTIPMNGGDVRYRYRVINTSEYPVRITKVYTSCMCTSAQIFRSDGSASVLFSMPGHGGGVSATNMMIAPKEVIDVEAVFDPAAHGPAGTGLADRTVFIETDSSAMPKMMLNFRAMVTR